MLEILGGIAAFIAIAFVYGLVINGISFGARAAVAGANAAITGKSFSEAMGHMPPMQSRIIQKNTEPDGSGLDYYSVEIKGLFPVFSGPTDVTCTVSLFDQTESSETPKPVLSLIEHFQERTTKAYFSEANIGAVKSTQGFVKWVEVGRIVPLFIQSPYSGQRNLSVVLRIIKTSALHKIRLGFSALNDDEAFWAERKKLQINQITKGYTESFDETKETLGLSVKLAMTVSMADGSLDESEGTVIKEWMKKVVTPFSDSLQEEVKAKLNQTMKESYQALREGSLSVSATIERFNEIGDEGAKYEAMELCYEVMAADGVADESEIKLLHRMGETLELDVKELDRIRDLKMMNLSYEVEEDDFSLLGIDPEWDSDKVQSHLRSEFRKWNARLNNMSSQDDRAHAQYMLDLIGRARAKYDE